MFIEENFSSGNTCLNNVVRKIFFYNMSDNVSKCMENYIYELFPLDLVRKRGFKT